MPDTDFTPALVEAAQKRVNVAADKKALMAWLREPDYVDGATIEWCNDWINRRPLAAAMRVCG